MRGIGTLINILAVILGGTLGAMIREGFNQKMRTTLLYAIGIFTLSIGFSYSFKSKNILIPLFAVLIGGIIGELIDIESALESFADNVKRILKSRDSRFSEGFIAASLLFCVGPMAILGSITDGLSGDYKILALKAVLDGFAGMALAASLGWGVVFSIITILLYQGSLTVLGFFAGNFVTKAMINEMTAAGGILIIGIGIMLLEIKRIRLANLLPSVFVAPLIVYLLQILKIKY
ncbi:MAG: DUF554 domain-containing protein [Actinobacteria bacterium]|nr:DUF554 domain-containing protein [Actinomycetota bacterium]